MTHSPTQDVNISETEEGNSQERSAATKSVFDMRTLRNRQRYLLWGVGSCLIGGMVIYGWVTLGGTSYTRNPEFKSSLTTGSSRINPQEAWMYQFRSESELTKKRLDAMDETLKKLLKINEASKTTAREKQVNSDPNATELIKNVREELKAAQKAEEAKGTNQSLLSQTNNSALIEGTLLPPPPGQTIVHDESTPAQQNLKGSPSFHSKAVRKISLSLKNARSNSPLKTVDNTIPAGAFAKAILLGGVDASASISASSDPRPALLRIMDPGTLPRKFHSDLMGCHVLAACYGDISSERVYMRLEKLTCTERKTGEIIEAKVQGYVAGEDGRTGVRGTVVDRAGESMRNAMMGGFIGGIGEFLSQSRNAVTFSPMSGLAQSNPMGVGELLKHGAGKGANNALEKYADFYIKRAEQVQPIIQVAAARHVDIVFTEGFSMSESLYRQTLGRSNDQTRYTQINSLNEDSRNNVSNWIPSSETTVK
jgi:conjugal transfer pilus assembly protein TraB